VSTAKRTLLLIPSKPLARQTLRVRQFDIMGYHSILNRFSPSAYKALFFCILQAKTDSIPII
jgi:hypothetical protein